MMPYQPGDSRVEVVDLELRRRQKILIELRDYLRSAQERMKKYADGKRKHWEFQEGELV